MRVCVFVENLYSAVCRRIKAVGEDVISLEPPASCVRNDKPEYVENVFGKFCMRLGISDFYNSINYFSLFKAFWLMVAWPPSGPTTVLILVVDYISELTIHSFFLCKGNVHHFIYSELDTADCAQLVLKDLEIVL